MAVIGIGIFVIVTLVMCGVASWVEE